jgi:PmbA protein
MSPAKKASAATKATGTSTKGRPAKRAKNLVKAKMARTARPDPDELLGRAESILRFARNLDAEVYLERGASVSAELETGGLGPADASQEQGGAWRVVEGGRLGFAYFSHPDQAKIALDDARKAARHSSKKDFRFPDPSKAKAVKGRWNDDVAQLDPALAVGNALEVLDAACATNKVVQVSGGGFSLGWEERAIASSTGVALADRSTIAQASVAVIVPQGATSISDGEMLMRHGLKEDWAGMATMAAERALSLRKPKAPGAAGSRDIVLHPDAVSQLVLGLAVGALHGDDAMRGRSFWSKKMGESVANAGFSITDDPFHAGPNVGAPFDDEGVACTRRPLVENGKLRSYLFSAWDATLNKAKATGHGFRADWKSRPSTSSNRLVTTTKGARPLSKLMGGIDDGYLVQSVLGAHTANDTTGDFSVTAPSVWRIRNGAVAGPCKEIALGGNIAKLLQQEIRASTEVQHHGGAIVPYMLLPGIQVSS